jgi:hypothetical protein
MGEDTNLLIHIGYPKTGSTWLQRSVFRNPKRGFFLSSRHKVRKFLIAPHAFDFEVQSCCQQFLPDLQQAEEKGLTPVLSQELLAGNAHTGGYDSGTNANRLAQVFPEAKILVVIREQKRMIISTYKQYVKGGGMLRWRGIYILYLKIKRRLYFKDGYT